MSFLKSDGARIQIEFTENITSDLDAVFGSEYVKPTGVLTAYNTYSTSYPVYNLIDENTSTYWRTSDFTECWLKVAYSVKKCIKGFKLYIGNSAYRPISMQLQGSDDNTTWANVGDPVTGTSTTGWKTFDIANTNKYYYYRINILSTASTARLYIYELRMNEGYGVEKAFTVTVPEYNYVPNGDLVNINKAVYNVSQGSTLKILDLDMKPTERFPSAAGSITISYDSSVGNLAGLGGPVASFSETFTPEDLIAKPHQNDQEHINVNVSATGALTRIYYTNTKGDEHINVSVSAVGVLTSINDI